MSRPPANFLLASMPEDDLLATTGELLDMGRWWWDHPLPALRADGRRRTAIMGHPGRPDIIAIKGPLLLWWELKTQNGELSAAQWAVQQRAAQVTRLDARVIRPSDLGWMREFLLSRDVTTPGPGC